MLVTLIELANLENFTNWKVCFDADLVRDFARICLGRMPTEVLAGYQQPFTDLPFAKSNHTPLNQHEPLQPSQCKIQIVNPLSGWVWSFVTWLEIRDYHTGDLNILEITLLHFGEDFSLISHIVNDAVSLVGKL